MSRNNDGQLRNRFAESPNQNIVQLFADLRDLRQDQTRKSKESEYVQSLMGDGETEVTARRVKQQHEHNDFDHYTSSRYFSIPQALCPPLTPSDIDPFASPYLPNAVRDKHSSSQARNKTTESGRSSEADSHGRSINSNNRTTTQDAHVSTQNTIWPLNISPISMMPKPLDNSMRPANTLRGSETRKRPAQAFDLHVGVHDDSRSKKPRLHPSRLVGASGDGLSGSEERFRRNSSNSLISASKSTQSTAAMSTRPQVTTEVMNGRIEEMGTLKQFTHVKTQRKRYVKRESSQDMIIPHDPIDDSYSDNQRRRPQSGSLVRRRLLLSANDKRRDSLDICQQDQPDRRQRVKTINSMANKNGEFRVVPSGSSEEDELSNPMQSFTRNHSRSLVANGDLKPLSVAKFAKSMTTKQVTKSSSSTPRTKFHVNMVQTGPYRVLSASEEATAYFELSADRETFILRDFPAQETFNHNIMNVRLVLLRQAFWCHDSPKIILKRPASTEFNISGSDTVYIEFSGADVASKFILVVQGKSAMNILNVSRKEIDNKFRNGASVFEKSTAYLSQTRRAESRVESQEKSHVVRETTNGSLLTQSNQLSPTRNTESVYHPQRYLEKVPEKNTLRRKTRQSFREGSPLYDLHDELPPMRRPRRSVNLKEVSPPPQAGWAKLNTGFYDSFSSALNWPHGQKDQATVEARDLETLNDGEYLNDNIIQFYLRFLKFKTEEINDPSFPKFHIMNSFFYHAMTNRKPDGRSINYDAVRKWTSKVDIFSHDYIVIPVCEHIHWFVVIVSKPGSLLQIAKETVEAESDLGLAEQISSQNTPAPDTPMSTDHQVNSAIESTEDLLPAQLPEIAKTNEPSLMVGSEQPGHGQQSTAMEARQANPSGQQTESKIAISTSNSGRQEARPVIETKIVALDSLGTTHPQAIRHITEWLVAEARDKKQIHISSQGLRLTGMARGLPRQPNYYDCGLFLLGYVEQFLDDPHSFMLRVMMKPMKSRSRGKPNFISDINATEARVKMSQFIFDLRQEQTRRETRAKRIKQFSSTKTDEANAALEAEQQQRTWKWQEMRITTYQADTWHLQTGDQSPRRVKNPPKLSDLYGRPAQSLSPDNHHSQDIVESVELDARKHTSSPASGSDKAPQSATPKAPASIQISSPPTTQIRSVSESTFEDLTNKIDSLPDVIAEVDLGGTQACEPCTDDVSEVDHAKVSLRSSDDSRPSSSSEELYKLAEGMENSKPTSVRSARQFDTRPQPSYIATSPSPQRRSATNAFKPGFRGIPFKRREGVPDPDRAVERTRYEAKRSDRQKPTNAPQSAEPSNLQEDVVNLLSDNLRRSPRTGSSQRSTPSSVDLTGETDTSPSLLSRKQREAAGYPLQKSTRSRKPKPETISID